MKFIPLAKRLTEKRVCVLTLEAHTFEEERILTALTHLMVYGGRLSVDIERDNEILEHSFIFTKAQPSPEPE